MEVAPFVRRWVWFCLLFRSLGLQAADPEPSAFQPIGATTFGGQNQVVLTFSHPLKATAATNLTSFSVGDGAVVTAVSWTTNRPASVRLKLTGATTSVRVESTESAGGALLSTPMTIGIQSSPWMPEETGSLVYGMQETFSSNRIGAQWKMRAPGTETSVPPSWALTNGVFQVNATTPNPIQLKLRHHLLLERPGYGGPTQEILARIRWRGSLAEAFGGVELGVSPTNLTPASVREGIHFRNSSGKATVGVNQTTIGTIADRPLTLDEWYWMRLKVEYGQPTAEKMNVRVKVWPGDGTEPEPTNWYGWETTLDSVPTNRFAGVGGYLGTTRGRGFDVDYLLIKAEGLPAIRVEPDGPLPSNVEILGRHVVPAGGTVSLRAQASSADALNYQWRFDGVPVEGATQAEFRLPQASRDRAGQYDLIVTSAAGAVTSAPVRIEVVGQPYYWEDFQVTAGPEWSVQNVDASSPLGERVIGPVKGSVFLTLPAAPATGTIFLTVDVYPLGGWLGSNPDTDLFSDFRVLHAREELFSTTFCNRALGRAGIEYSRFEYNFHNFPGAIGGAAFPPLYGATRVVTVTSASGIGSTTTWFTEYPIAFQFPVQAGEKPVLEFRNLQGLQTPPFSPNRSFGLGHIGAAFVDADASQFRFAEAVVAANEATGFMKLRIERLGASGIAGEVGVTVEEETAFAGRDFILQAQRLKFAAGETLQEIDVPLINDDIANGSRRFRARLLEPGGGATLGDRDVTTLVIGDDESSVRFRTNRVVARESDGQFQFQVDLFGPIGDPRWFDVVPEAGSAIEGPAGDFVLPKRRVILAPGTTQFEMPVSVVADGVKEAEETFRLRLVLSEEDRDSEFNVLEGSILEDAATPLTLELQVVDTATMEIQFPTGLGRTYRIERSDALGSWTTLQEQSGTGAMIKVTVPTVAAQQFFRVLEY